MQSINRTYYPFIQRMGEYSYSTYMWHMAVILEVGRPIFGFLSESGLENKLVTFYGGILTPETANVLITTISTMAVCAVVGILSKLSFDLIEKPFLAHRPAYIKK